MVHKVHILVSTQGDDFHFMPLQVYPHACQLIKDMPWGTYVHGCRIVPFVASEYDVEDAWAWLDEQGVNAEQFGEIGPGEPIGFIASASSYRSPPLGSDEKAAFLARQTARWKKEYDEDQDAERAAEAMEEAEEQASPEQLVEWGWIESESAQAARPAS
jgi:hypothetical protein